jgi:uncharacterized protein YdhG (YjbR/CyaY superfamily)
MSPIDDYIAKMPRTAQRQLRTIRDTVRAEAPDATETIAYGMPAFKHHGVTLAAFGAFKAHVGFYPGASAIQAFASELHGYETAKGSIRFPLDHPMPVDLIRRIVQYKLEE